ncbi:hypothetical protein, partial [Escherichia coli]|uniref:hypothetical protein n=2 Tax=Escherichia coli TaxID=562 RepID=UPI002553C69D
YKITLSQTVIILTKVNEKNIAALKKGGIIRRFFCGCPSKEKEYEDRGSQTPTRQTQAGTDA